MPPKNGKNNPGPLVETAVIDIGNGLSNHVKINGIWEDFADFTYTIDRSGKEMRTKKS